MLLIVLNGTSSRLCKEALGNNLMTLQQLLLLGLQDEMSPLQAADIEVREAENSNCIRKKKAALNVKLRTNMPRQERAQNCGGKWPESSRPSNVSKLSKAQPFCNNEPFKRKTCSKSQSQRYCIPPRYCR